MMFLKCENYTSSDEAVLQAMGTVPAEIHVLPDDMVSLSEVVSFVQGWGEANTATSSGRFLSAAFAQAISERFTPAPATPEEK